MKIITYSKNTPGTGSSRCKRMLTAISDVPRSTSSTKISMLLLRMPRASPRKATLGPIILWHLSDSSPTTRLMRSAKAFRSRAESSLCREAQFCANAFLGGSLKTPTFTFTWVQMYNIPWASMFSLKMLPRFQSARRAGSSGSRGNCPISPISRALIWSTRGGSRVSYVSPWTKTLCWVSKVKSMTSSCLITPASVSLLFRTARTSSRAPATCMNLP